MSRSIQDMKVQKKTVEFCMDCSFVTVSYSCVKVPNEVYSLV